MRWLGGKWMLAPRIISQFPAHRVYVEPFAGAASVLLRKPRSYAEILNDIDHDVVNLFKVLRDDDSAARLVRLVQLTPFAREEFKAAYEPCEDPVERARRLIVRSFLGFGSDSANALASTSFRASSNRNGTTASHDWANYPEALSTIVARLSGVLVENRPAIEVMLQQDSPDTLHYLDPPYMPETRSTKSRKKGVGYVSYRHEMVEADHEALLDAIRELSGMVVLSGYSNALYDAKLAGWERLEMHAVADGGLKRTEVLWISPNATARRIAGASAPSLFDAA